MKTNSSARWFVRIRGIVFCVALVVLVGVAFGLGGALGTRIGQTTARQSDSPAVPNVSISDLMAAAP